jgi:hypothetical protein
MMNVIKATNGECSSKGMFDRCLGVLSLINLEDTFSYGTGADVRISI